MLGESDGSGDPSAAPATEPPVQSGVVVCIPIEAGDRGHIDGVAVAGICSRRMCLSASQRITAIDENDLDDMEATVTNRGS